MNKLSEKPKRQEEHGDGRDEYECPQCRDTELIIKRDEQGNEIAIFASVGSEKLGNGGSSKHSFQMNLCMRISRTSNERRSISNRCTI